MAFQTPRTVEEMLTSIHRRDYLMPAIQREFVWGPAQIIRLVDSLMRGYPVGSFLLWEVQRTTVESYTSTSSLRISMSGITLSPARQPFLLVQGRLPCLMVSSV